MLKVKGIISTLLMIIFAVTAATGIILLGETHFGIKNHLIKNIHKIAGVAMIFIVIFHFIFNRKLYAAEMKIWKNKK